MSQALDVPIECHSYPNFPAAKDVSTHKNKGVDIYCDSVPSRLIGKTFFLTRLCEDAKFLING